MFNRSYLEIGILKQSHFFTVHQKHNTRSSHINMLTITHPDLFVMIFQRSVVLLSDSPCRVVNNWNSLPENAVSAPSTLWLPSRRYWESCLLDRKHEHLLAWLARPNKTSEEDNLIQNENCNLRTSKCNVAIAFQMSILESTYTCKQQPWWALRDSGTSNHYKLIIIH